MLVTFRREVSGEITMFGDVAVTLLKLMGHSGIVPGALLANQIPSALARLKKAIETPDAKGQAADGDDGETKAPRVSLANRAYPLVEMLTAAATEQCDVMWDKN
jgi:hypothetical protein